jgi:hypothetical protein
MTETETLVGQAAVEAIMRRIAREEIAAAGRAILAEQASDLRQGDGKTLRRYRPGGYGNMVASADGTYVYGPDADIIISAERAAREKAEAEVTRLKAVSEGYRLDAEEAEAELADLRKRVLAEVDRIFPAGGTLWINGDDHAGFKQITRIVDGLNRIRALLSPSTEPKGGGSRTQGDDGRHADATHDGGPDIAQPARDASEPPAPVYYPTVDEHYDIIRDGETQDPARSAVSTRRAPARAVWKGADSIFEGTIQARFFKRNGKQMVVLEDDRGLLHIYPDNERLERRLGHAAGIKGSADDA